MNVDDYLAKIGCPNAKEMSLENLRKIRTGHVRTFAFENCDMHMGKKIKFSLEDAYDRLIHQSRGGYCIQLNFTIGWALKQLGYELYFVPCYIYNSQYATTYNELPVHIAMIVKINNSNYFLDAGTSRFLSQPLEITLESVQKTQFGVFKFVEDEANTGYVKLTRSKNAPSESEYEFVDQCRFKLEPKEMDYFKEMNEYVQTEKHPMIFYRTLILKHGENKIFFLIGWKYTEVEFGEFGETRTDRIITNIEEIRDLLKNKFQLKIDESFRPVDTTI